MGAVVADVIKNRIDRVRHQLGALIAEPLGWQHFRLARVFRLQPVDDLRGNKFA
ncbi:hypothetical protein D3C86_1969640 [compost metagenome]